MKTVLDLIGEFAILNDAKVSWGGRLPPGAEERWEELKNFYDLLMSYPPLGNRPVTRRFSKDDISAGLPSRDRLRVPQESDILFQIGGEYHTGTLVNLSRGGVFIETPNLLPVRADLKVYVASVRSTDEALLEVAAEVAWVTERGIPNSVPKGMGIAFPARAPAVERRLDSMVIETLERHLSGLDATCLAPDFVVRERLTL